MRDPKPSVYYNEIGDQLEIRWDPEEAYYAEWKNPSLTLLRSMEDREKIVGVDITGFRRWFLLSGLKLDKEYDEHPPLTPEEQEEADKKIQEVFGSK